MQKINTQAELRVAILLLEAKQAEEGIKLKEQFLVTVESIKPINLIKSTLMEAANSEDLQDNLINSTLGMSAGYLSKILFQSFSDSPVKKMLGTAIMFGIKNLVAQNPELVKSLGKGVFDFIRKMFHDSKKETPDQANEDPLAM